MLKKFLTSLFCAVSIVSFAQDNDLRKVQLGVNYSPDLNYRTLQSEEISLIWSQSEGIPVFGFTTGVNAVYNFTHLLGLEIGLQYSQKGYQGKRYTSFDPIQANDPNIPEERKTIDKFHYIDVPIKCNLTVGKSNVRFIGSVGFVTNVYISSVQTNEVTYGDDHKERVNTTDPHDYSPINISPMVSAGIDYKITNRNSIRIEPTFRYGVLKVLDTPQTVFLWNCGLNISWYFGL